RGLEELRFLYSNSALLYQILLCMPDMNHCIIAGRSDARTVGRPCYATDLFSMTSIGEEGLTCSSLPYLDCPIFACRSDALASRRPCYRVHFTSMHTIGEDVA